MRNSHIYLFAIGAATVGFLAIAPGNAAAQDEGAATAMPADPALAIDQMAEQDRWPAEQQAAYEAWPDETKAYYWSLTPQRQKLFWRISDDDKIAITAMTGPERDGAWSQIEAATASPPPEG